MQIRTFPARNVLLAMTITAALSVVIPAQATNGYFGHGYGTKNKGLAGAGTALPQDAMAAATNPAGMVFVGERLDMGLALFSPSRSYEVSNLTAPSMMPSEFPLVAGKVDSDSNYFAIPHLGKNWMLGADARLGLTLYGNGGMNTDYPGSVSEGMGTYYGGAAGVNLEQLFVNGSYARKTTESSSLGLSLIFAYQRLEARGLSAFGGWSTDPNNLSDRGVDSAYGWGFKLGWMAEVIDGLTLGAAYQSKIAMGEFDRYAGLFAGQGDFDIPANWNLGLAYGLNATDTLVFDVQHIQYSDVASVGNPMLPALWQCFPQPDDGGDSRYCIGDNEGPGFGWQDMTVYKLGYQWVISAMPEYNWRAGYSYSKQPIPDTEVIFNILAPGVTQQHVTLGMTRALAGGSELSLALMYAPKQTLTGRNQTVATSEQQIRLQMTQWELEISYRW